MRILLAPRWLVGHVVVVLAVIVFLVLGAWQLRRHEEKVALRDDVAAASALPVAALAAVDAGVVYRVVAAEGRYRGDGETLVLRSRDGTSGYHVLTPFVMDDGASLLVDRGWVPRSHVDSPETTAAVPSGVVTVVGLLWPSEGTGVTPGEPAPVVRRIDPAQVAAVVPNIDLDRYLILESQDPSQSSPILSDRPTIGLGPHLGYAGQWTLFALVVVVGYPFLLRRIVRGAQLDGGEAVEHDG